MIKVTVFQMIDFEALGEKHHVSISGGIATHSLNQVDCFEKETISLAMAAITERYGKPFIFDDRLELQVSDSESYSFYLDEVISTPIDVNDLRKQFNLEER